ncbi:hypothetical protein GCM10017786_09050 [Amycolatopsis deserti]|uniref:Secreted protein/lipoprotein n=1 Tax=Amycolatopsis deserti TaxID=185696 RepID=A0ABQ3IGT8_9PSEU|nr:hypothetical protein [Amycolatopsis deserti]GHE80962.1 hypothetical protein GCM10017786_09050 [Amycolatopsis deserti]
MTSLVLFAACTPDDPTDLASGPSTAAPAPSAAVSTSPSPTGEDKAKQEALAAYRAMWADFVQAGITSDWQSPKLGDHATGLALTNLSRGLYADHYNGLVTKGQPILNPTVSSVEPAGDPVKIIVSDCGDSTNWLKYRADNGQLADDEPGGRHAINAIVEKQADGSWKVTDYGVHDAGTC